MKLVYPVLRRVMIISTRHELLEEGRIIFSGSEFIILYGMLLAIPEH